MELIDKIKNKFNKWVYNLWDSIGEDNNWHIDRKEFLTEQFKKIVRAETEIDIQFKNSTNLGKTIEIKEKLKKERIKKIMEEGLHDG